jgi:hypothetical protein
MKIDDPAIPRTSLMIILFISSLFFLLYNPIKADSSIQISQVSDSKFQNQSSDTCKTDSLKHVTDSLTRKLFVAEYKLQRVKYYLNIAIKNPSQTKFLKGWIKRAIQ